MATVKITDLHFTGSDLFLDSESYLNELTDEEMSQTHGGIISTPVCVSAIVFTACAVSGYFIGQLTKKK